MEDIFLLSGMWLENDDLESDFSRISGQGSKIEKMKDRN